MGPWQQSMPNTIFFHNNSWSILILVGGYLNYLFNFISALRNFENPAYDHDQENLMGDHEEISRPGEQISSQHGSVTGKSGGGANDGGASSGKIQ